jgi:hypothetical protein
MWLARLEFDLVPVVKLLVCLFLVLKTLDLAFPAVFKTRLPFAKKQTPCAQEMGVTGREGG